MVVECEQLIKTDKLRHTHFVLYDVRRSVVEMVALVALCFSAIRKYLQIDIQISVDEIERINKLDCY